MNKEELLKFLYKMRDEHEEMENRCVSESLMWGLHNQSKCVYQFIISEIENGEFDNER